MSDAAPVIAIDGPSGSGKGTIARLLAVELGWQLLDSGALYRILGAAAADAGIDYDDAEELARLAADLDIAFSDAGGETRVLLGVEDVSSRIRSEECGAAASRVAAHPAVRAALLERQRDFCRPPGLVADGRDMGTVVFPAAKLKIFLTASAEERARRRHKQLIEKGMSVNLAQLLGDIAARDKRDAERAVSPLEPARDAVIVDTTGANIDVVMDRVRQLVVARGLA